MVEAAYRRQHHGQSPYKGRGLGRDTDKSFQWRVLNGQTSMFEVFRETAAVSLLEQGATPILNAQTGVAVAQLMENAVLRRDAKGTRSSPINRAIHHDSGLYAITGYTEAVHTSLLSQEDGFWSCYVPKYNDFDLVLKALRLNTVLVARDDERVARALQQSLDMYAQARSRTGNNLPDWLDRTRDWRTFYGDASLLPKPQLWAHLLPFEAGAMQTMLQHTEGLLPLTRRSLEIFRDSRYQRVDNAAGNLSNQLGLAVSPTTIAMTMKLCGDDIVQLGLAERLKPSTLPPAVEGTVFKNK